VRKHLAVYTLAQFFLGWMPLQVWAQSEGVLLEFPVKNLNPDWIMPRTEYGHPDFQGTWLFGSRTPMQRPVNLGTKQTYTEEEVVEMVRHMQMRNAQLEAPVAADRGAPEAGARIGQEADDNFLAHFRAAELIKVNGEYRTSVITDPPHGRLPVRKGFKDFTAQRRAAGLGDTDGPEGQPLSGRCLMFGAAVPSLTPLMMNPHMQIVQNEDYVMIMTEMVHDARIIKLSGEHSASALPSWMGESVGDWEGDTLVVHTKNFRPEQSAAMLLVHSEDLAVIERYTLVGDDAIHYAFTATDPQAYTQPVRGERMITRNAPSDQIYEFACHEGNYSLANILAGARRAEADEK